MIFFEIWHISVGISLSSHHKFPRHVSNADEIHALGQIGNINLLGFSGDLASH